MDKMKNGFLDLPVLKTIIIIIISAMIISLIVKEIVFNQVLKTISAKTQQFSIIFSDDKKDMEKDYNSFKERQEYDALDSEITSAYIHQPLSSKSEDFMCYLNKRIGLLQKKLTLKHVKRNPALADLIKNEIQIDQKSLQEINKNKLFNPASCKE